MSKWDAGAGIWEDLRANWRELKTSLLNDTYELQAVRREEIPKDGGRVRLHLEKIGRWIRRRLRMCVWKQWKNVSTRVRNLKKLGLMKVEAIKFGNSRKGYWR